MRRIILTCGLVYALGSGLGDASWLSAEEQAGAREVRRHVRLVTQRVGGDKWIGIHALPIDEALQSQLHLSDRLIIRHIIPNSPADQAGLRIHDILLKYGDREITTLDDLLSAVSKNADDESSVVVLREGKERKLSIKPEKRPAESDLEALVPKVDIEEVHKVLGRLRKEDGTSIWRAIGPGIVPEAWMHWKGQAPAFPDGLSLSITKEKDSPARIVAKQGEKTYETTADRLDVLPEDIRRFAERAIAGGPVMAWELGHDGNAAWLEAQKARGETGPAAQRRRIEVYRSGEGLEDLRKDVETLKREVERLKSEGKPDAKAPDKK
ncbi:MAG: PDZ domain-containing protein [Pirellulaceae bacterium]